MDLEVPQGRQGQMQTDFLDLSTLEMAAAVLLQQLRHSRRSEILVATEVLGLWPFDTPRYMSRL
jgi:hypothetical protein